MWCLWLISLKYFQPYRHTRIQRGAGLDWIENKTLFINVPFSPIQHGAIGQRGSIVNGTERKTLFISVLSYITQRYSSPTWGLLGLKQKEILLKTNHSISPNVGLSVSTIITCIVNDNISSNTVNKTTVQGTPYMASLLLLHVIVKV